MPLDIEVTSSLTSIATIASNTFVLATGATLCSTASLILLRVSRLLFNSVSTGDANRKSGLKTSVATAYEQAADKPSSEGSKAPKSSNAEQSGDEPVLEVLFVGAALVAYGVAFVMYYLYDATFIESAFNSTLPNVAVLIGFGGSIVASFGIFVGARKLLNGLI